MQELSDIEYARIMSALSSEGTPEDRAWVEQWAASSEGRHLALQQFERVRSVLQTAGQADIALRMQQLRTVVDAHIAASTNGAGTRRSEEKAHAVLNPSLAGEVSAPHVEAADVLRRQQPGLQGQLRDTDTSLSHEKIRAGIQAPSWKVMYSHLARAQTGWRWLGAVCLAGFLVVGTVQGVRYFTGDPTPIAATESAVRTISTRIGQQVHYRFPDGSSALLAPGTTVQYGPEFGVTSRTVELRGEALFTISPHETVPFLVRTGNSVVRVLGTTFSVRRYPTDTTTNIVVAQGKVAIGEKVLTSGDAATVNSKGTTQIERGIDIRTALGWTTGNLAFWRRSFRGIIPDLERWYGVSIHATDSRILDAEVTATFLADAPDRAFDVLARVLQADVSRHGRSVTFQPQSR